jgi:ubiquinone biosynthesis UbiH/UbiF/VisC/COQ6 family hydroxylase
VVVLEPRAPEPFAAPRPYDLRTYALSPASAALLERLGAWRDVLAVRACPYHAMRVWEQGDGDELRFDASLVGEAQLGWIVEDGLLRHVLWQRLLDSPRATLLTTGVAELTRDGDAALALADGRRVLAKLVVAADGAGSPLRRAAGIVANAQSYGERAIVANVRTSAPHGHTAWQRFTREGPLAFLPLGNGECSIVWSVKDATADALLAKDDDAFRSALGAAFQHRLGDVVATSGRVALPLRLVLAPEYAGERFALVGDAAHAVHPLAGQGLNLGLLDAAALAECVGRDGDAGEARRLRDYARWRTGDNALAARSFDLLDGLFRSDAPGVGPLRRFGMGAVARLTPLKRELALHAAGFAGRVPELSRRP